MSTIIHDELPPVTTAVAGATYEAFALNHDPVASSWSDREVQLFALLSNEVRAKVKQTGPEAWSLVDPKTHQEMCFSSCCAAVLWLENYLVTS